MRDLYDGFPFPVLRLTQGDRHLSLPIWRDMQTPEALATMAAVMERDLLRSEGKVLPSRVWWVTESVYGRSGA